MKKIYFACSIRGGRDEQPIYQEIVSIIKQHSELLSELFADKSLTSLGHKNLSDYEIWGRDMDWLNSADGVIAEVSTPSLGVGYELAKAEEAGKKALVLYRPKEGKRLSAMIAGSPNLKVVEYQLTSEIELVIKDFIKTL